MDQRALPKKDPVSRTLLQSPHFHPFGGAQTALLLDHDPLLLTGTVPRPLVFFAIQDLRHAIVFLSQPDKKVVSQLAFHIDDDQT